MNELLDVLDENGRHTGISAPRTEIHNKGFWHATVHIYVYQITNGKIEVLTHLRAANKDLYPNTWDPVLGGHVKTGVSSTQTAIDELLEEINLSISENNLIVGPVLKANKGLDREFNHLYAYKFSDDIQIRFTDKEVQAIQFMELGKILQSIQISPNEWRPTREELKAEFSALSLMGI